MMSILRILRSSGLTVVLLLAACGGGGDLEGTYFLKMGEGPGEGVTMELKDDGVAVVTLPGAGSTQGTYKSEGNTLTVLLPGDTDVYTVDEDGNLTTTAMGETMVMVRQ